MLERIRFKFSEIKLIYDGECFYGYDLWRLCIIKECERIFKFYVEKVLDKSEWVDDLYFYI